MSFVEAIRVHEEDTTNDVSSIPYIDPQQAVMEYEVNAFEQMHFDLVSRFLGDYVAIYQGQVVDSDSDQLTLIERIDLRYPDQVVLIRQVQQQLPPPLNFRSPRLERK